MNWSIFKAGIYITMESQMCRHYIKSHGAKVARSHLCDWLVILLLGAIDAGIFFIDPFHQYLNKSMMADLKYPLKSNLVPVWAVGVYSILLPFAIFIAFYIRRRDVYDLHNAILGLAFSIVLAGVVTDSMRNLVGRPRPDFFWRCFPDGVEVYDRTGNVVCHGKEIDVKEGYRSFPSGHVSWSFASLGFLALYLSGKAKAFNNNGHVCKLVIFFLPLYVACLVGVSRLNDYWHHWQDVFAGAVVGIIVATFSYLHFFPPPHYDQGWGPYAYFRAVEESRRNRPADNEPDVESQVGDQVERNRN